MLVLRDSTADVVELIVAWRRQQLAKRSANSSALLASPAATVPVFMWNDSVDYLHKLCTDLDFMSNCDPLGSSVLGDHFRSSALHTPWFS